MPYFDLETRNLINLFAQTPEMFCLLNGPEHLFTFVNEAHGGKIWIESEIDKGSWNSL